MGYKRDYDYHIFFHSPEELAKKVLQVHFNREKIVFPIDPFEILRANGIVYQLRNFENLEGIYVVPEDNDDIPVVGINNNRPITRQRFTAAHEICHHIKDRKSISCPCDGRRKDMIEKYADNFAAALLMPIEELKKVSEEYINNGFVEFEDIIKISDYFGVSFESCVFRLAYKVGIISGNTKSQELKKRIKAFHPERKRIELGLDRYNFDLLKNQINNLEIFIQSESLIVWNKFKINFVYNENRLEGVDIDWDEIGEIITDLRINSQSSDFCKSEYKTIIEVVGHSDLYDFISNTNESVSIYQLGKLHRILYNYSPYPEASGIFRNTNNLVLDSKFETSDYSEIPSKIKILEQDVNQIVQEMDCLSVTDYIDRVVRLHHSLTVIHPFNDGNGRVLRVFLNWLFRIRGLPPVYIKHKEKQKYTDALSYADQTDDYKKLYEIFYREIIRSMIELNSKFS
ncbi:MAG: ImmA/IrrE family metallo-endopeptidase [Anaerolineaceae bacterium]